MITFQLLEVSVDALRYGSLGSFIAAAVFFLVAVALFFLLEIPKVIGDLSGSTAKKAIENIRQQNEGTGDKAHKPSVENLKRGKVTDKISNSGRIIQAPSNSDGYTVSTAKLKADETEVLEEAIGATEVLQNDAFIPSPGNETAILGVDDNAPAADPGNETTILSAEDNAFAATQSAAGNETTVLSEPNKDDEFGVDYAVEFKGSSEIIE